MCNHYIPIHVRMCHSFKSECELKQKITMQSSLFIKKNALKVFVPLAIAASFLLTLTTVLTDFLISVGLFLTAAACGGVILICSIISNSTLVVNFLNLCVILCYFFYLILFQNYCMVLLVISWFWYLLCLATSLSCCDGISLVA